MSKCHKCDYNKYGIFDPNVIDLMIKFTIYSLLFFLVSNEQSTKVIKNMFKLSNESTEYISSIIFGILYVSTNYIMNNSKI